MGTTHLNTVLAAEVLVLGAVHVDDSDGGVVLEFGRELVECWLHRLAVASPRRQELHQGVLAADRRVKVGSVALDAGRDGLNTIKMSNIATFVDMPCKVTP